MSTIEHGDVLDLRELAELANESREVIENEESDAADIAEAKETLRKLGALLADIGYSKADDDYAGIADELDSIGNNYEPALIAADYFTAYSEELCKDIGDIPSELPWYIANHIDWEAVAGELKADYMEVELDDNVYFLRSF